MRESLKAIVKDVDTLHQACLSIEGLYERRVPRAAMRAVYRTFRAYGEKAGLSRAALAEGIDRLDKLSDLLTCPGAERDAALIEAASLPGIATALKVVEAGLPTDYFTPARAVYLWARDVFSVSVGFPSHILESRDESVQEVTQENQATAVASLENLFSEVLRAAARVAYPDAELLPSMAAIRRRLGSLD